MESGDSCCLFYILSQLKKSSPEDMFIDFLFFNFKKDSVYLFLERGREGERGEKH